MRHLDLGAVDRGERVVAAAPHPAAVDHGDRVLAEVQCGAARVVDHRLLQQHSRTAHRQYPVPAGCRDPAAAGREPGRVGGLQPVAAGLGDPAVGELRPGGVGDPNPGPYGRVDPAAGQHGRGVVLHEHAVAAGAGQDAVPRQQTGLAPHPQRGPGDASHPQPLGEQHGGAGEHHADAVDLLDQCVLGSRAGVARQVQGGVAGAAQCGAAQQQDAAAVDRVGQLGREVGGGAECRVGRGGGAGGRAEHLDAAAAELALLKGQRGRVLDPHEGFRGVGAPQHQAGEHAVRGGDGDGGSRGRAHDDGADAALGFQDDPSGEPECLRVLAGLDTDDRARGGGGQCGRDGPVGSPAPGGHPYHRHAVVPPFEPSAGWV